MFKFDDSRFTNSLFGQAVRDKELHRKAIQQQMLSFDLPAASCQIAVDLGNPGGQALLHWNENDVRAIPGKWFYLMNGRKCSAQRPILDHPFPNRFIGSPQYHV